MGWLVQLNVSYIISMTGVSLTCIVCGVHSAYKACSYLEGDFECLPSEIESGSSSSLAENSEAV